MNLLHAHIESLGETEIATDHNLEFKDVDPCSSDSDLSDVCDPTWIEPLDVVDTKPDDGSLD